MRPSAGGNRDGPRNHPIPRAPDGEIRGGAILQIPARPQALRACANTACRFSIATARGRRPNPAADAPKKPYPRVLPEPAYRPCVLLVIDRSYVPSAVTGRAACQLGRSPNLSLPGKFLPNFFLVGRSLPVHVVDVFEILSQHRFRIPMTVETPLHQQRVSLKDERHLIHGPVTGAASHAFVYVDAVVEIDKIRQPVDFYPLD